MRLRNFAILAALVLPSVSPAAAHDFRVNRAYGIGYGPAGAHYRDARSGGFAQPFVSGDYIGAPFSSVPSPTHLVPTPWSYGTYGIPTVSGIPASPAGAPTLTVIHSPSSKKAARRAAGPLGDDPADVRVVNVSVPRR